jgi:hypothetical protein
MSKLASRRTGRAALIKLLPLSTEKIRTLSLENHLALSVVRVGAGDFEQMSCLPRAVYLAYFMRRETTDRMNPDINVGQGGQRRRAKRHLSLAYALDRP